MERESGREAAIEVARMCDREALGGVRLGYGSEDVDARFGWLAESIDGTWLLLRVRGVVIGWCVVVWSGKATHPEYPDMQDLWVRPEHRSRGHGTRLIREVERLARSRGHARIGLAVNPDLNPDAKRLYERLGYVHDGGETYLDGIYDGNEDWVVDLEKEL
jgi:GNAT superfamily N-acetyltransferase